MESIHINPQRRAELEEYARRRGQDAETALDEALAEYLEWERQDFTQATEGIRRGYEDVKAGRTRPASEVLADLRRKHDLPH
jgi:predicted transcriptional regulator